ncbi:MAG TPA: response regulator [Candidatus Sulfotelmatobacter sp.]
MIAVIGVDQSVRSRLEPLVKALALEAVYFRSSGEFISSGRMRDARCIVVDAHISGMGGRQLQSHLASSGRYIPMIFITSTKDLKAREEALRSGALDILRKPDGESAFIRELASALRPGASDTKK